MLKLTDEAKDKNNYSSFIYDIIGSNAVDERGYSFKHIYSTPNLQFL